MNKSVSLISLIIIATNPLLVLSSSRSMPDIPQTLFFSIAVLGLVGIFKSVKPIKNDLWLFYMGFSFSFATKGIPAVVFLILSVVFLLFNPWRKYKLSELIYWPAIITGLVVALFWYIIMYIVHGNEFLLSFFNDQLGVRIAEDRFRVLRNVATALLALIGYLGFFIFPFVSLKIKTALKNERLSVHILLFIGITMIWLIAMFVFSVFTVKFYDRYFLPVFPLISVLIAVCFQIFKGDNTVRYIFINRIFVALFGVLFTSISIILSLRLGLFHFSIAYIVLLNLFIVLMFAFRKRGSLDNEFKKLSGLILLVFFTVSLFVSTFSFPDQGTQIAGYLNSRFSKGQKIVFYGEPKVAAKLNVSTSGNFNICCIKPTCIEPRLLVDSIIIYRQEMSPVVNIEKYTIECIADEWKAIPVIPLISGQETDFINKNYQTIYVIAAIR